MPQYPIEDWIPTHAQVDSQRYPQPGDPNPDVRVGVVSAAGGRTVWVKLPIQASQDYIPRFGWADRRTLWIETLTRDHKHRDLYLADAETGQARQILESERRQVCRRQLRRVGRRRPDRALQLDRRAQPSLSLLLRRGPSRLDDGEAGAATDQRRFRSARRSTASISKTSCVDFASNEGNPLEQQFGR